jgi:hypothetical protein
LSPSRPDSDNQRIIKGSASDLPWAKPVGTATARFWKTWPFGLSVGVHLCQLRPPAAAAA